MSDINLDWDKILDEQTQDPSTAPAPEGPYDIRVTKAEATRASTGSPMIKMTCEITSGPYATKAVWTNIVFKTDSTTVMRMALQNLSALGVSREWIAENSPPLTSIASELVGATAVAELGIREWQSELRNEVKRFKPLGASDGVPPAPVVASDAPPAPEAPSAPDADAPASTDTPPTPAF